MCGRAVQSHLLGLLGAELEQHGQHRNELLLFFHRLQELEDDILEILEIGGLTSLLVALVSPDLLFQDLQ